MADPHALYDEAEKLKDDGKYQEAIAKYLEILEPTQVSRWPTSPWP